MKIKSIFLILVTFFSTNCYSKWDIIDFDTDADGVNYIESDYNKKGNFVKFWLLRDYINGIKELGVVYYSSKILYQIDCKERQSKTQQMYFYSDNMGNGKIIDSTDLSSISKWKDIIPNSKMDVYRKTVC